MTKKTNEPKILLDSDVVRHFLKGGKILDLPKIYPNRLVMLDVVRNELCLSTHIRNDVNKFITFCRIDIKDFSGDINIIREYARLRKQFGNGESACMAVAKYDEHYIASSNLSDIKDYCIENGITYLTTMDILLDAISVGIFSDKDCDKFISEVKQKGSKLPTNTIKEYRKIKPKK
jgi:predicted nucleic acid-binding protein